MLGRTKCKTSVRLVKGLLVPLTQLSLQELPGQGGSRLWPQWLYQAWPLLWISHSGLTGPSVRSELCASIWTGPSDLRQNKIVFVSFKKGFDKDISPATISSWIKQTVILCCELSDQETHTLHQVRAHDVRVFVVSKAFQSGVSSGQILSACH